MIEHLPVLCRVSGTYLREKDVAEYCAGANEDEQHEVKQEDSEGDNLEHQAVVMVGKIVDEGRDRPRTHDYCMPSPSKMTRRSPMSAMCPASRLAMAGAWPRGSSGT